MILSDIVGQIPEEATYQSKLRSAVFDAVSESDVADIVKGIVTRAKDGDQRAVQQVFDYVIGKQQPARLTQNNYYQASEDVCDDEPIETPGSPARIEQLRRRAAAGKSL